MGNNFKDSQEVLAAHCTSEEDKGFLGCLGGLGTQREEPWEGEETSFVPSPPAGQRGLPEKVMAWFLIQQNSTEQEPKNYPAPLSQHRKSRLAGDSGRETWICLLTNTDCSYQKTLFCKKAEVYLCILSILQMVAEATGLVQVVKPTNTVLRKKSRVEQSNAGLESSSSVRLNVDHVQVSRASVTHDFCNFRALGKQVAFPSLSFPNCRAEFTPDPNYLCLTLSCLNQFLG